MFEASIKFDQIPKFATAMKIAAPDRLLRATGKAFFKIGRSDTEKIKAEQLQGGSLNVRAKGFLNAFKSRAGDSRTLRTLGDLTLSEYTGAKPLRIFNDGGEISPSHSRTLTVLAPGGRTAGGKRKYTQKQLREMVRSGELKIIQTRRGAAIIKPDLRTTKSGADRRGNKITVIAWLRPRVTEKKRIDFFQNFNRNSAAHDQILEAAADEAIQGTLDEEGD